MYTVPTEENTMATTTNGSAKDLASGFDQATDRVRALNEKLIDTAKKTGGASLDAYEKALSSLVDFQQKAAGASQLDWVSTMVNAQTTFLTEISAAYTTAAREALK
jgi:hypothetical protein